MIASSYSGNTEETLAALEEALAAGAHCVAVGTGGKLEQRALAAGLPYVPFHYNSSPRAAIGYSFALIAGVLRAAGVAAFGLDDLHAAAKVMRNWQAELSPDVPTEANAAKQLALRLHGRVRSLRRLASWRGAPPLEGSGQRDLRLAFVESCPSSITTPCRLLQPRAR